LRPKPFALERYMSRYEFRAEISLSSSDCDSLSQQELVSWADDEARRLWDGLSLGYTESSGMPLLRAEIAAMYEGLTAADVLEVVPSEGILVAMSCMLGPGDHVIATFPSYQSLYGIAESIGCDVTRWRPDEARGWRFDLAALRAAVTPRTRLIVVNFPHNPTGYLPSRADFDEIVAIARAAGAYLFSDEMYRFLELESTDRLPSACEVYEKAVTLSGLSKSFGLPGLRVGWLATRDAELQRAFAEFKDFTTICGSAPSEILALIGLRNRERLIGRNLDIVKRNIATAESFFAERGGLMAWNRPRAGSIGLARLRWPSGALDFCERLMADEGVMLLPSSVFDFGDEHVRLGLGRSNFADGLGRLAGWLDRRSG